MNLFAEYCGRRALVLAWLLGCLVLTPRGLSADASFVAEGVVVFRENQTQADEFAPAVRFKRREVYQSSMNFDLGTGRPLILANYLVAGVINFQDFSQRDLIKPEDRSMVEKHRDELTAAGKRFPRALPYLKPVIAGLDGYVKQLAGGEIRVHGQWMLLEQYQAQQKRAEEEQARVQMAAAKTLEDQELRLRNLKSKPSTIAGRWLLDDYEFFSGAVSKSWGTGRNSAGRETVLQLPDAIVQAALPLPSTVGKSGAADIGLTEGRTLSAPAILFAKDAAACRAFSLGVALKIEDGKIVNTNELQAAVKVIAQVAPSIAEWLPLGLTTVRAKLDFQRNRMGKASMGSMVKEMDGRLCELVVGEPAINSDGSFYSLVIIMVL